MFQFWCEVAICCFHPFPGTSAPSFPGPFMNLPRTHALTDAPIILAASPDAEMTKTLGMAMFLRAYVLLHLARCFNPIYIHRALIQKIPGCALTPYLDRLTAALC